ncbi:hypothetical protein [Magnetospirillum molischianum]|uniref:Uncharacterized protein n=1 Tax=Magnetospirillum molischianum DSM 120 TaxID=1150626 RepID=H8FY48_MAGML|nr:hypothetical protein [Magnetospirillum molischianum]CCG43286.1 conserved hypothetical protein [Magnetospirillum molischianum DSM 120]
MKKIRIVEPGFEGYNGYIGITQFVDGVAEVDHIRLSQIAAAMRVEDAETERQVGPAMDLIDAHHVKAEVEAPLERGHGDAPVENVLAEEPAAEIKLTVTREELEGLADKKGIAGLREIGDQLGVKSNSIPGLIDKIVQAHEVAKAKIAQ